MMANVEIKDLYVGKPDAKDEVTFGSIDNFVSTYVIPPYFDIDELLYGDKCFITGFKGTGKTALLLYLDYVIQSKYPYACTSFVFFKDDFPETKKREMNNMSLSISSCVSFDDTKTVDAADFDYIWRWILFKRLVSDNEEYSDNLFINDDNWINFKRLVDSIKEPLNRKKHIIPSEIKLGGRISGNGSYTEASPEISVSLEKEGDNYSEFVKIIDQAERYLIKVKRTDTPYYVLVDELEAYYGDEVLFKRDLRFIRDLIFAVKRLNEVFACNGNTKIICSVRSEILNAISRFIISKEMNKVINGFEMPLIWNYSNTNSYQHPIIQILLKRIAMAEDVESDNYKELFYKWFPENINGIEPANYILNNSWNKPRDIVRLISSARSSIKSSNSYFSQDVFDSLKKKYSEDSLDEIREELRALYGSNEIELIITCFTGYKTRFSFAQLKIRISELYPNSVLEEKLPNILQDLYRLGFLGNYLPSAKTYRWQHKGDNSIILNDEWRIMVHYALHSALSLNRRQDYGLSLNDAPQIGDVVSVKIDSISRSFAFGYFYTESGIRYKVAIHISQIKPGVRIERISDYVSEEEWYSVELLKYDEKYDSWGGKPIKWLGDAL